MDVSKMAVVNTRINSGSLIRLPTFSCNNQRIKSYLKFFKYNELI